VNELTDFDFSRAKNLDSSALESSAEKIRKVLKAQGHQEAG
jgi:hypothetical protein